MRALRVVDLGQGPCSASPVMALHMVWLDDTSCAGLLVDDVENAATAWLRVFVSAAETVLALPATANGAWACGGRLGS